MRLSTAYCYTILFFHAFKVIGALPSPTSPSPDDTSGPSESLLLPESFAVRRLKGPDLQAYIELLAAHISGLGYQKSKVTLHLQSLSSLHRIEGGLRSQMEDNPLRLQFLTLADDGHGSRVFAMPLTAPSFNAFRDLIGNYGGRGRSHKALIFRVAHKDPTALSLSPGCFGDTLPEVELYGLASVTQAFGLPGKMQDLRLGVDLRDVLRP